MDDRDEGEAAAEAGGGELEAARIAAGKHRALQEVRTGGRKLFDHGAKAAFLDWFGATCNLSWAAEKAGFNYKTVLRHWAEDGEFGEACERAMAQGYRRLEAKRLETKRQAIPIGIEGEEDSPEMPDMAPERMDSILRERGRLLASARGEGPRKQGRRPRIATNAEVREELLKALKAFERREKRVGTAGAGEAESPPPPRPSPIEGEGQGRRE